MTVEQALENAERHVAGSTGPILAAEVMCLRERERVLVEALGDLVSMCEAEFVYGGPPTCDFEHKVLPKARAAIEAVKE